MLLSELEMIQITKDNISNMKHLIDFDKYEIYPSNYTVTDKIQGYTYLFFDHGKFVAVVSLMHYDEDNLTYIVNLFVEEKYRRQKIGTQLLNFAVDKGGDCLCVDDDNEKAISLYMKNGFTVKGKNENFLIMMTDTASPSKDFLEDLKKCSVGEASKEIDKKLSFKDIEGKIYYIQDPKSGIENSVYDIDGEQYRVRVETIVKRKLPDGTPAIFFEKKDKETHYGTMYRIPGGSIEPHKPLSEQAEAECNEECLIKVKNMRYTGKYYIVKYDPNEIPEWHKKILWPVGLKYVGAVTFVFTAEYDGPYKKKVAKEDQDALAKKGDWYPVWDFEELKSDVHDGISLEEYKGITISQKSFQEHKNSEDFMFILKLAAHSDEEIERYLKQLVYDKETKKVTVEFDTDDKNVKNRFIKWANQYSKVLRFTYHGNEVVVTNKKSGKLVTESSMFDDPMWQFIHGKPFDYITEEYRNPGKTFKRNIIPVDLRGYKEPGSRVMCLNTHQFNIASMELTWLGLGAIESLVRNNIGALGAWIPWIGYDVLNLKDQLFALDFFAVNDSEEVICNDLQGYPVVAINDGIVVESLNNFSNRAGMLGKLAYATGNHVIISHNDGKFYSLYAHLQTGSVRVKEGDVVKQGDLLGLVGHSGNSDPDQSHLHFEMFIGSPIGEFPVKPTNFAPYKRTKEFSIWDLDKPEKYKKIFKYELKNDSSGILNDACILTPPTISAREEASNAWDQFCKDYDTPEMVLKFLANRGAHWPTVEEMKKLKLQNWNDKRFTWPEEMITKKRPMALCFDYAVFFHLYFQKRKIKNHVVCMGWFDADKQKMLTGHAICCFQRDKKWYIVDYHEKDKGVRKKMDMIIGPADNLENLVEAYVVGIKFTLAKHFKTTSKINHYYIIQSEKEMKRYYDDKQGSDDSQMQIVLSDFGRFFRNSLGTMMQHQGYPSWMAVPFIPVWTVLDAKDKIEELFESVEIRPDIIEEFNNIALDTVESDYVSEASNNEADPEIVENVPDTKDSISTNGSIIDTVLHMLGDKVDKKQFSEFKTGKKFMYTRCRVMQKFVPLIVFLAYCEGLTTVLRKAGVKFFFSDTRPRLEPIEATRKGIIPFSDGFLIYDKYPFHISLLMNGLSVMNTKCVEYAEMDGKDVYVELFDTLYGVRMLANALSNFYDLMIDSVTREVLEDLNYPTDFVGLMLAGNKLLSDNNYVHELDMRNWRIRNNEQAYAHAYKKIADAYAKFRATADNKNPAKISIPRDAVIESIMTNQIVEDVSELSPIVEVKKNHIVLDKGPSGTNLEESYTMERRCYHPSMVGVMSMSTSPDGNCGIQRELTVEPNVVNARGYVVPQEDRPTSEANLFSMSELLSPGGAIQDDQIRSAMASKQSSHVIPVRDSSPVLMSNGAEKIIPYHLSNDFSIVAKDDGEVVERNDKTGVIILKYKNLTGKDAIQIVNMNSKVVKNGAGGFFLTNKMNCDKLKKGTKFKKNDVLAYNDRFFSDSSQEGVRYNIGTLTKIACASTYANFEDSDLITDKLSKRLGTEVCMEITATVGKNSNVSFIVKKGQEVKVNDPLIVYDSSSDDASFNQMLAHIGKELKEEITGMGKTPIKSKYAGIIEDIKIYSTVETKEMSPSLRKIVESYYDEIRAREREINKYYKGQNPENFAFLEQAKRIEPTAEGKLMGLKVGEGVLFRFFIKYNDYMDIGDKLVMYSAIKCVNGEMIPKGKEPFTVDRPEEEISTTFAPAAILARMVPSIFWAMYGNKVIVELKRKWLEMYQKDNPSFKPKDDLY